MKRELAFITIFSFIGLAVSIGAGVAGGLVLEDGLGQSPQNVQATPESREVIPVSNLALPESEGGGLSRPR